MNMQTTDQTTGGVAPESQRDSQQRLAMPREQEPRSAETSDAVGGGGAGGLHTQAIRAKAERVRECLARIERDVNADDVIHGYMVHALGMEVTDLVYECGLYNGRVVGGGERDGASERNGAQGPNEKADRRAEENL